MQNFIRIVKKKKKIHLKLFNNYLINNYLINNQVNYINLFQINFLIFENPNEFFQFFMYLNIYSIFKNERNVKNLGYVCIKKTSYHT